MVPFERGFQAFLEDMPIETNPYKEGTEDFDDWMRGWFAAADADLT